MKVSYLLFYNISYLVFLNIPHKLEEKACFVMLVVCPHTVLNLKQVSFYQHSYFLLFVVTLVSSLLILLQK